MRSTNHVVSGLILAIALFAVGVPGWAADGTAIEEGGQHLKWKTPVQHDGGVLSIATPSGEIVTQKFGAGETPAFTVIAKNGDVHPDGSYTFELRFFPKLSDAQKDSLAESRDDIRSAAVRIPVMSGTFGIVNGSIVIAEQKDTSSDRDRDTATKDVLHYDDVIITGSLCVGFDCANGESFGYDTHKLKENNLRLYFEDTSVGSFPSGDWRIRINDTTSGGASYFAVEDGTNGRTPFRIETGAPTHSLYVEDYGRVGLGTSVPYVELHIADGDTPTVRLDQDGSSGWTAQSWDMAGNETNFFIRDVTNGSKLSFRIQPNTPSSTLSLRSTGNVGIGTWSPAQTLDISDSGPAMRFTNEGSGHGIWDLFMNPNTSRLNYTDDPNHTRVPFKLGPGANNNLLKIGTTAANRVDIMGNLVVSGTITPDFVFNADFELESIEEHSEFMWREKHLPAVSPATLAEDGKSHQINVGERSEGLLKELEKAHIYIAQLNSTIVELRSELVRRNEEFERRLSELEALPAQQAQESRSAP